MACAIKVLNAEGATTARLKRFKNEIDFCSRNVHPNIIQVLGSGITATGATFYAMHLYSGTLRDLISKRFKAENVLRAFGQILDGVEAAHLRGVFHRDLKPENILASAAGDSLVVADFGIARFNEEVLLTAVETEQGERLANFLYAAPEQKIRNQNVDSKADIYALGLMLNEMFTGVPPLGTGHKRIAEVAPDYSYLDGLVEGMRSQDPSRRPSIADFKRELIGRGNEFLVQQRLNALKSQVIPETEADDPIVRNPIALQAIDFVEERLQLTLSREPPPNWVAAFRNPISASRYHGHGPERFEFFNNMAYIHLGLGVDPQQLLDFAKTYIDSANLKYAREVIAAHRKKLDLERAKLREKVAVEQRRQEILAKLKI